MQEERPGHKVDFNVTWQDYWKKEKWEVIVGEFSGKPFEPLLDKCKCKLFRCMKDILDLLPYRKSKGFQDHIHNLIEKLWAYLRDGIVDEILKTIKIHESSTTIRGSSYASILQNSRAITIVSPIKYQQSN
ncbi:8821_t:CDS:2 [Cetraspora pellucida]|uniref:8821_t:CDS:1 n=1 Tax=Cetraspora pellucida TaxID=1433469 RepID=A0ACA9M517_9GLOM|nr:8821_t:CDS:2 [Cetraspora pellucida]